jgi:hypothetical protein
MPDIEIEVEATFEAMTPEDITNFSRRVLKEYEAKIISCWNKDVIGTTITNPSTKEEQTIHTYPSKECNIRVSTGIITSIGKSLKLQKRRGLYLL